VFLLSLGPYHSIKSHVYTTLLIDTTKIAYKWNHHKIKYLHS
jgi:hypothetical protein